MEVECWGLIARSTVLLMGELGQNLRKSIKEMSDAVIGFDLGEIMSVGETKSLSLGNPPVCEDEGVKAGRDDVHQSDL